MLDWSSNFGYCPATGRVIACAGRPATSAAAAKLVWYDLAADEWDGLGNPFGVGAGHFYQSQCVSTDRRRFFYLPIFGSRVIQVWNTQTWAAEAALPQIPNWSLGNSWGDAICLSWHPNIGTQGSLIAAGGATNYARIARFDWASQTWTELYGSNSQGYAADGHWAGVYVPGADACIVGRSSNLTPWQLFKIDAAGNVIRTAASPSYISASNGRGIITPHHSRAALIHLCYTTQKVWSYEVDSDTWVDRGALPVAHNIIYQAGSTIPELGVIFSVRASNNGGDAVGSQTWVYRPNF